MEHPGGKRPVSSSPCPTVFSFLRFLDTILRQDETAEGVSEDDGGSGTIGPRLLCPSSVLRCHECRFAECTANEAGLLKKG